MLYVVTFTLHSFDSFTLSLFHSEFAILLLNLLNVLNVLILRFCDFAIYGDFVDFVDFVNCCFRLFAHCFFAFRSFAFAIFSLFAFFVLLFCCCYLLFVIAVCFRFLSFFSFSVSLFPFFRFSFVADFIIRHSQPLSGFGCVCGWLWLALVGALVRVCDWPHSLNAHAAVSQSVSQSVNSLFLPSYSHCQSLSVRSQLLR